jgi:hypothetical protein
LSGLFLKVLFRDSLPDSPFDQYQGFVLCLFSLPSGLFFTSQIYKPVGAVAVHGFESDVAETFGLEWLCQLFNVCFVVMP